MKWRTQDGRRLDPSCMTCAHLRNCIARILRMSWRLHWLDRLTDEYARRCKPNTPDVLRRFSRDREPTV